MADTYQEFQDESSSSKVILATINASRRLVGWVLESGSIFKLTNFDVSVIVSIEDSGIALTSQPDLASVVPGSFFNDRANKILFLETSDSANPNSKFVGMTFKNFFANQTVHLANDIGSGGTGFDVFWEPLIQGESGFGVELDNDDQIGLALEGSASINFIHDRNFWDSRYEKFLWDNQVVCVFSWSQGLPASEAKTLFEGFVNTKKHSNKIVTFRLKDQVLELRAEFPVDKLEDKAGVLIPEDLNEARQRRVYGRKRGFRPTNIDQIVDGYPLTGTVSVTANSKTLTGVGTLFLKELSPDDEVILNGVEFSVESVSSDLIAVLTEAPEFNASTINFTVIPDQPKKFINREWLVAGHACRQLETTVSNFDTANRFTLVSVQDLRELDEIFVGSPGSGETVSVARINGGNKIVNSENLLFPPNTGESVIRPCVQNLRINNRKLEFDRDFTIVISATETKIVLTEDAEKNINPVRSVNGTLTFSTGTRTVTATGSQFQSQLKPSQHVRPIGTFDFFEILSIESDTSLTLRVLPNVNATSDAQYKGGTNFDPDVDFLSCDILGTTSDGTKDGNLLENASDIVKDILAKVNITNINVPAFDKSAALAKYSLGLVIPKQFNATTTRKVRDIINEINVSVFGSLIQNNDFEFEYGILAPKKPLNFSRFRENDIIDLSIDTSNDRSVKQVTVFYDRQELNPQSLEPSVRTQVKVSDVARFLVKTSQEREIQSLLFDTDSARILAGRWSFLLEVATNVITITTKLQASRLQVNDIVEIEHKKLFERIGGGKRKFAAIQAISKSADETRVELDDLSNAFNRVATIAPTGSPDFDNSSEEQKASRGFITDTFGLINNDADTFELNRIW